MWSFTWEVVKVRFIILLGQDVWVFFSSFLSIMWGAVMVILFKVFAGWMWLVTFWLSRLSGVFIGVWITCGGVIFIVLQVILVWLVTLLLVSIILGVALVRGFWERLGLVEGRGFIALLMAILVWVRLSMGTFSWYGHAKVWVGWWAWGYGVKVKDW